MGIRINYRFQDGTERKTLTTRPEAGGGLDFYLDGVIYLHWAPSRNSTISEKSNIPVFWNWTLSFLSSLTNRKVCVNYSSLRLFMHTPHWQSPSCCVWHDAASSGRVPPSGAWPATTQWPEPVPHRWSWCQPQVSDCLEHPWLQISQTLWEVSHIIIATIKLN